MDLLLELPSTIKKWLDTDPYVNDSYSYLGGGFADGPHVPESYPSTAKFYTHFELNTSPGVGSSNWARDHLYVPFVISACYLLSIVLLRAYMRDRKHWDVRRAQVLWNGALAIFSICGAARLVPHLILMLTTNGLHESICDIPRYGLRGPSSIWTIVFIYSKVPELGDTYFIILGKRKLLFLHWYHHVTVMLFTWYSYSARSSTGIWFASMNYTVHGFMYMYFALMGKASLDQSHAKRIPDAKASEKALKKIKARRAVLGAFAPAITALQILQMIGGMLVLYQAHQYMEMHAKDPSTLLCHITRVNWLSGAGMYASYFVLFAVFAINRYCSCSSTPKSTKLD